jgi:CheY-like chemotaxis protein
MNDDLPTVLIVEDEAMIRELYFFTLTRAGYTVKTAGSSTEAFSTLREFKADIIFLDIMLPGMSGLDILKTLRSDAQYNSFDSRIVLITNLGQQNLAETAMQERADGYIIKADIVPKDLITVIESFRPGNAKAADNVPMRKFTV